MSISPFSVRPTSPENERRRTRLVLMIAVLGIAATLLAYAISPGVRREVRHAAHSVGHVLDRDKGGEEHAKKKAELEPGQKVEESRRSATTSR